MTYSTGGLIQATDYNGFVSTTAGANINATWNSTYGQTALSTVAVGGTVTATQWSTLNSTLSSMATHQGTTVTSRTNPVAGNIISVLANVNTDITNCYTNRYNAATSGTQVANWTGTNYKATTTGSGTSAWTITFTNTVTFANATAASSFFGAGGLIKIQYSKTSTGVSTSDAEWNAFAAACGTTWLSSTGPSKTISGSSYTGTTKTGGSGTPTTLATTVGYQQLTGTPQNIFVQYDTGAAYTSNYIVTTAAVSGAVVTFVTVWNESGGGGSSGSAIAGGTGPTGATLGTAPTTLVTYIPPETTNLTNTWGTPTVAATTV
jgi:hypothetical protein